MAVSKPGMKGTCAPRSCRAADSHQDAGGVPLVGDARLSLQQRVLLHNALRAKSYKQSDCKVLC